MFDINNMNNMLFFMLSPQNEVDKAITDNLRWTNIWYGVLSNIMSGIFKYNNVPKPLVKRLNVSFFTSSYVGAYEDDKLGIVIAPCIPIGKINNWGEYPSYDIILPTGDSKRVNIDDVVIGYNYDLPTICDSVLCYEYAKQIAEIKLSIDNAIILSRKTAMVEVPNENATNEVLTKFNNHTIGVPIIVSKRRPEEKFETLELANPNTVDEYYNGLRDILNEFLTTTGLSSLVNPNKKERLITDEISSNDDIKNTLLSNRINNRELFISAINEKFGTNWEVNVDDNIYKTVNNLVDTVNDKGVNEDEH